MTSRAAVEWAASDAMWMGEPLRIVHAAGRFPYQISGYQEMPDRLLRAERKILREAEALVHERQPAVEVTTQDIEGTPTTVLRDQAKQASGLMVGSRGWATRPNC